MPPRRQTVAPLSGTDHFGYYGLRVRPSFEQAIGQSRQPLGIPIPNRWATWYSNSPYRSLIIDAEQKYNDFEHAVLDYRQSGAELPMHAAMVRPSDAGDGPSWDRMARHQDDYHDYMAHQHAQAAAEEEEAMEGRMHRRQQLVHAHYPRHAHAMMEAHHEELAEAGVSHHYIGSHPPTPRARHYSGGSELPLGTGRVLTPQLPPFQWAGRMVRTSYP
jgi:hypothetical protein